jgi:hypothetical protein
MSNDQITIPKAIPGLSRQYIDCRAAPRVQQRCLQILLRASPLEKGDVEENSVSMPLSSTGSTEVSPESLEGLPRRERRYRGKSSVHATDLHSSPPTDSLMSFETCVQQDKP